MGDGFEEWLMLIGVPPPRNLERKRDQFSLTFHGGGFYDQDNEALLNLIPFSHHRKYCKCKKPKNLAKGHGSLRAIPQ